MCPQPSELRGSAYGCPAGRLLIKTYEEEIVQGAIRLQIRVPEGEGSPLHLHEATFLPPKIAL